MKVFPIKGAIQNYAWGGKAFIPALTKTENTSNEPFAELWMGAHDRGPATIEANGTSLAEFIAQKPVEVLSKAVATRFDNRLPFLFKVLDVGSMLSIQSHPTKRQAEIGFEAENKEGIPIKAKHRNFRDDNHKPEVMVALTEFWLLHGFRAKDEIAIILEKVPEFESLRVHFQEENSYDLYKAIMNLPQAEVDTILAPLRDRLAAQDCPKDTPDYWARQAFEDYTRDGHFDRGIFSIYLFNLVRLREGEGIFQDAGIPHAYLEGVNMELMANSDNVFRGGLTPKHIDVPKLLDHLVTESVKPHILLGKQVSETERVYRTPAPDFELSRIDLDSAQVHKSQSPVPDISIVLEGKIEVRSADGTFTRTRGEVFFAVANTAYELVAKEKTVLYRATVPSGIL